MLPTRIARIEFGQQKFAFALPIWSVRLGGSMGQAIYVGLGDPRFAATSGGWRYIEQMGAAHLFKREGLRLIVETRKRSRWLTEMRLTIEPNAS